MVITYLCPAEKKPSGGVKVIYRHSEILNRNGVESFIYHPKNQNFSSNIFSHSVFFRKTSNIFFNFLLRQQQMKLLKISGYGSDFIVIPEIWALRYGLQCIRNGFKYAIFVQGGYLIGLSDDHSRDQLNLCYEKAEYILSISNDTSDIIKLIFPSIDECKIIRILPHISKSFNKFDKEKIISYMPRRLAEHSEKICFYLHEFLPHDWKLVPIDNKSEDEVANILNKSSIFLSFCDQEGCPLPPLEAAFSGNIVVGYTGQGAREYFSYPIFREVNNGDYKDYVEKILCAIKDVECDKLTSREYVDQLECLKCSYSEHNEIAHLMKFVDMVKQL